MTSSPPPSSDSQDAAPALRAPYGIGDTLGPYRLLRQLGEGTAGTVFEVEHVRIGRRAAMKIVHRYAQVPELVSRLFVEAQAVNLIGNPHIVEITDVLEPTAEHPVHALVMELLEGTPLADLLTGQQPLPVARLLPIMAQVCDALAAVHEAGFIHRDLKPENVFLVHRNANPDFVKLLDFGLVKAMRPDVPDAKATVQGTFLGSPAYASPEQAAGKTVDFRTDIYAVGVMLYELVTGRLPFEAESIGDVLIKQISEPAPRLGDSFLSTDVGQALDAIIQTCLAKDPAERGLSARQLADMFRLLAAGATRSVRELCRSANVHLRARPTHRLRTIATFVAAGVIALLAGTHGVLQATRSGPVQVEPAASAQPAPPKAVVATPSPLPGRAPAATKAEPRNPASARQWARALGRIDRATTLDPYR